MTERPKPERALRHADSYTSSHLRNCNKTFLADYARELEALATFGRGTSSKGWWMSKTKDQMIGSIKTRRSFCGIPQEGTPVPSATLDPSTVMKIDLTPYEENKVVTETDLSKAVKALDDKISENEAVRAKQVVSVNERFREIDVTRDAVKKELAVARTIAMDARAAAQEARAAAKATEKDFQESLRLASNEVQELRDKKDLTLEELLDMPVDTRHCRLVGDMWFTQTNHPYDLNTFGHWLENYIDKRIRFAATDGDTITRTDLDAFESQIETQVDQKIAAQPANPFYDIARNSCEGFSGSLTTKDCVREMIQEEKARDLSSDDIIIRLNALEQESRHLRRLLETETIPINRPDPLNNVS